MIAMFCDDKGVTPCGTDSMLYVDGRFCVDRMLQSVAKKRQTFKKNFPHKFKSFSHVYFVNRVCDSPTKIYKIPLYTAPVAGTHQ